MLHFWGVNDEVAAAEEEEPGLAGEAAALLARSRPGQSAAHGLAWPEEPLKVHGGGVEAGILCVLFEMERRGVDAERDGKSVREQRCWQSEKDWRSWW